MQLHHEGLQQALFIFDLLCLSKMLNIFPESTNQLDLYLLNRFIIVNLQSDGEQPRREEGERGWFGIRIP